MDCCGVVVTDTQASLVERLRNAGDALENVQRAWGDTIHAPELQQHQQNTIDVLREAADQIEADAARIAKLEHALRDFIEDMEARWDMNDPRTNPGIRHCVEQGRKVLEVPHESE